jgi:hypothetical protein
MFTYNASKQLLVVSRTFNSARLPPNMEHLECYTLICPHTVLIENKSNAPAIALIEPSTGRISCNCAQAERRGKCDHQQALSNGLCPELNLLSHSCSLLVDTKSWCKHKGARPCESISC